MSTSSTPVGYVKPSMSPVEKAFGSLTYAVGGNSNSGSTPFGDYYGFVALAGFLPAFILVAWAFRRRKAVTPR